MRAAVAPGGPRRHAADRSGAGDRPVCAGLSSGRAAQEGHDADGGELARIFLRQCRAESPSAAASELAQYELAEAPSLVRRGGSAGPETACGQSRAMK